MHTYTLRQSSLIKDDVVGPLLSNSSYRNRIFMGVYLNHFCWHKHAVQQRRSEMTVVFCRSLPLNLPLCLRTWHLVFVFLCHALHCGPITAKSSGLIVARRPVVTQDTSRLYAEQQGLQFFN